MDLTFFQPHMLKLSFPVRALPAADKGWSDNLRLDLQLMGDLGLAGACFFFFFSKDQERKMMPLN